MIKNCMTFLSGKRRSTIFNTVTEVQVFHITSNEIAILKAWISFQSISLPNAIKYLTNVLNLKFAVRLNLKKICNMQIMLNLPTNKPRIPFNPTADFYNSTHVAGHSSIVFTNNISFQFNHFNIGTNF